MNKIKRMCTPISKHEDDFIIMVSRFSGIGYGRMKQIITGVWANFLMESSTMSEQSALLGALDLDTWIKQENLKLESQNKKLIEALKNYVTGEHYKMRSNGRLVTPEIAETVLKEVENETQDSN